MKLFINTLFFFLSANKKTRKKHVHNSQLQELSIYIISYKRKGKIDWQIQPPPSNIFKFYKKKEKEKVSRWMRVKLKRGLEAREVSCWKRRRRRRRRSWQMEDCEEWENEHVLEKERRETNAQAPSPVAPCTPPLALPLLLPVSSLSVSLHLLFTFIFIFISSPNDDDDDFNLLSLQKLIS